MQLGLCILLNVNVLPWRRFALSEALWLWSVISKSLIVGTDVASAARISDDPDHDYHEPRRLSSKQRFPANKANWNSAVMAAATAAVLSQKWRSTRCSHGGDEGLATAEGQMDQHPCPSVKPLIPGRVICDVIVSIQLRHSVGVRSAVTIAVDCFLFGPTWPYIYINSLRTAVFILISYAQICRYSALLEHIWEFIYCWSIVTSVETVDTAVVDALIALLVLFIRYRPTFVCRGVRRKTVIVICGSSRSNNRNEW